MKVIPCVVYHYVYSYFKDPSLVIYIPVGKTLLSFLALVDVATANEAAQRLSWSCGRLENEAWIG